MIGLVIARHNEIRDEIIHIAMQAFSLDYIYGEPLIHLGHSISADKVHHGRSISETRGRMSIRGLWEI